MTKRRKAREPEQVMLNLCAGDESGERRILSFHRNGKLTYLWIGPAGTGPCYGHVGGPKTLASFARTLLREVLPPKRKVKR